MASNKRLRVNVGRIRQYSDPPFPSSNRYIRYMRAASKALTDELLSVVDQFENVTPSLLMDALEPTFLKTKVYVPKKTLGLLQSAYLVQTSTGKSKYPRVELGYARGGKPSYAAYVHEILYYKHAAPTRAKFVESAMKEDVGAIFKRLGSGYRGFMSGVVYG